MPSRCRRTLVRHVGALVHDGLVPLGRLAQPGSARAGLGAGEPVGEDLVADLVGHPGGRRCAVLIRKSPRVGDVAAVQAGRVQPAVVVGAPRDQEAVRRHLVDQLDRHRPPRAGLVDAVATGPADGGLAVAHRAHAPPRRRRACRRRRAAPGRAGRRVARGSPAESRRRRVAGRAVVVGVERVGPSRSSPVASALHAAGGDAADDEPLQVEEQQHHGDRGHDRRRPRRRRGCWTGRRR